MPATSKAQYRFMQAVAHGTAKDRPKGLSRKEAGEYVAGQNPKGLPKKKESLVNKTRKKLRKIYEG